MSTSQVEPRVVVVGAGPAGLLTAHYLREHGYRNVVILEKLGRVGGLCDTVTADGRSFDLGANYVTPGYTQILKLAETLGVQVYSERPFVAMTVPPEPTGQVRYQSVFSATRQRDDGSRIPLLSLGVALIRYTWIRWRLGRVIDRPTFAGVATFDGGSLCAPLEDWLKRHRLTDLERVFQLPITLMGFGYLDKVPAIYAMKFMTVGSFVPMVLKEMPLIGRLISWPRRFLYGYQRFFERLAWGLDVRTSVDIQSIERTDAGVQIVFDELQQDMNETARVRHTLTADYLIMACPLNSELLMKRMDASESERRLFSAITSVSYCMTTRSIELQGADLGGNSPLAAVYPAPALGTNVPYGVAKQWADSTFAQFYTRTTQLAPDDPAHGQAGELQRAVETGVDRLIAQMGATPAAGHEANATFNRFEYFQHVSSADLKAGWYDDLERLQGQRRTFYVGGATNFELIEPIAEYAQHLVATRFPARPAARPSLVARLANWWANRTLRQRRRWHLAEALLAAMVVGYIFFMPLKSVPIKTPIGMSSPEATAATERMWTVLHADDASQIPSLLAELEHAYAIEPRDAALTAIMGGMHLWRFHLRARLQTSPADQERDLAAAIKYGQESIALDGSADSTARSLTATAEWQLAVLRGELHKLPAIQMQSIENSLLYPQFAGFVQGWMLASMLPADGPDYDQAMEGYHFMLSQCAGFNIKQDTTFRKLTHTLYGFKSILEPVCYNNHLAPHSIEGTLIGYGDAFLKKGDLDRARIWYENAKTSPTYATWRYKELLEYRLANLATLSQKFIADSGRLDVTEPAMNFQSEIACGVCHTR
ncbi:MAG: NAD(P)-binding protein [Acidobacteriota bacterium]|nr:NAD(P)-binding protein [Acidobacteriota bacterium]